MGFNVLDSKRENNSETQNIKELEVLAHSFNSMTQKLQDSFRNLDQANTDLEQKVAESTMISRTAGYPLTIEIEEV